MNKCGTRNADCGLFSREAPPSADNALPITPHSALRIPHFPLIALCILLAGCQQEMADQPSYRPLQPSGFFADGRSARPQEPGTIARGQLLDDSPLRQARSPNTDAAWAASLVGQGVTPVWGLLSPPRPDFGYVTDFPIPITSESLKRGQERYTIFCAVCHGTSGAGDGTVVQRGYTRPPSFHTDSSRGLALRGLNLPLRQVPVGYYYEVISKGYGSMPDYASQIADDDRWKIIAYIRALQLSQHAPLDRLTPEEIRRVEEGKR